MLDEDSFREVGPGSGGSDREPDGSLRSFSPANFILGFGKINGRNCVIGGEDFTIHGGSPNEAGLRKSVYTEGLALQNLIPLIRLHQGGGGSVAGSIGNPVFNTPRFKSITHTMWSIPVATAALGAVAGLPAARLVSSHFSVITRENSQVLVAGPKVIERAIKENISKEDMGGAQVHTRNGVVNNIAEDEPSALKQIKQFLSYMPRNAWGITPKVISSDPVNRKEEALLNIIPRDRRKIYDMRRLMSLTLDKGSVFETAKNYARGQITCFARLNVHAVGVFSDDCGYYAGSMTADGSQKVRCFIQTCETFNLPIITFVDEPSFMIGSDAEKARTISHGTDLVLTVAECQVPWVSILVRKSFGVAAVAHYGPDAYVLAWPSAEIGAVPVEGEVAVAFSREIKNHANPEAKRAELEKSMAHRYSAVPRAESLSIHDLICPREKRPALCDWIERAIETISNMIAMKTRLQP